MHIPELIRKKRDGEALSKEEIEFLVKGFTKGEIPDYQFSALLMAIYFQGMSENELLHLTRSYIETGIVVDFSGLGKPKVDKHSTGGVGDKVSIPLAPLVASCDVAVPMLSGRGLGHTGGTLDKLESIPNLRTNLTIEEFKTQVEQIGVCIAGQTKELAPADGKIYALRDVTATVDSIPLIAASIMSKKLAEGIDGLVLDVKTGSGAFMQKIDDAIALAQTMTKIGSLYGKKVMALITDMNQPLGNMVGNELEIIESVEILQDRARDKRLLELILTLSGYMLIVAGIETQLDNAINRLKSNLSSGKAYERFERMVMAQGGDINALKEPWKLIDAKFRFEVPANISGYISSIDTRRIGLAVVSLGAGRLKKEDIIDHSVGIIVNKKLGDKVEKGEPLAEIFANDESKALNALNEIQLSYNITEEPVPPPPLIYALIDENGVKKFV